MTLDPDRGAAVLSPEATEAMQERGWGVVELGDGSVVAFSLISHRTVQRGRYIPSTP